jgi:hypothetical protein
MGEGMEINTPEELVNAIDQLIITLNRAGRVRFLKWVKDRKRTYDLNYPTGFKVEEKKDDKSYTVTVEPVVQPTVQ